MQHGLADRAEQHSLDVTRPCEPTTTSCASCAAASRAERTALGNLPQDGHLRMLLLVPDDRLLDVLLQLKNAAQASRRIGKSAHRQERSASERGLLESEAQRSIRCRGSVGADHDGTGRIATSRPPVPAHDHHWTVGMCRNLPADRAQQHPGDAAAAPGADDQHVGIMAVLAEHSRGLPADQQRPYLPWPHEVPGPPQPVGDDPFTAGPRQTGDGSLTGQSREARCPGMTYRERDPARSGLPGSPAQRVLAAR